VTTTLNRPSVPSAPSPPAPPASPRPGRLPNRTSPVVTVGTELALVAVTAASALGLARLFLGGDFVWPVLAAAFGGHALAWFCRQRDFGLLASALISAGGCVLAVAWLVEPHTTFLLIPRGATWRAVADDLRIAWEQFGEVKAPTEPLRGFILAAVAGTWLTATTSDFFAFRVRARFEAMAPAFTLFVFGSILGADRLRLQTTALYLAALLAFVLWSEAARTSASGAWFAGRSREGDAALLRSGASLGAVAVLVALLVGPHLPGAGSAGLVSWRDAKEGSSRSRVTVSPLVEIRGKLVQQSDMELFTVGSASPHYWRLTSLDRFDGAIWSSLGTYQPTRGSLPGAPAGPTVTQDFAIGQLGTIWLPAAFRAERVSGVKGARFDRDSASLLAETSTVDNLRYQVVSVAPQLSRAQLEAEPNVIPPEIAEHYLALPENMPANVVSTARLATISASTPYAKARALQDWFRQNFTYDLNIDPGHGNDAMSQFLSTRRGYCEQFAGSYAAMARALGIPARVAVGFVPGTPDGGRYRVHGRDAHAWPEVWLGPTHGWVAFEPTPGAGRDAPGTQSYTGIGAPDDPIQPQQSTATTAPPTSLGDPSATTEPQFEEEPQQTGGQTAEQGRSRWILAFQVLVGGVLLYFIALPGLQRWIVRRRRRAAASPTEQVLVAWQETEDALALAGHPRHPAETAAEYASRAAPTLGSAGPHLTHLAGTTEVAGFAAAGVPADAVPPARQAADAVALELRSQASRIQRLRWQLDPRPLADAARELFLGPARRHKA
jgi:transglutaminase-like putative cysteine protease